MVVDSMREGLLPLVAEAGDPCSILITSREPPEIVEGLRR